MSAGTEKFVLRTTLTSPFGRKARMGVEVLGLQDRVTVASADVMSEADTLRQQNPLGKIPCLVRGDGTGIFDSGVILEFLQDVAGTDRLLPARGSARFTMLTQARLADGIVDAAALIIYEGKFREPGTHSQVWLAHQHGKMVRALAALEAAPPDPLETNMASIAVGCAVDFLYKRNPAQWRPMIGPRLLAWLSAFAAHEPALERTSPPYDWLPKPSTPGQS
jgi:glutathione S-transferase